MARAKTKAPNLRVPQSDAEAEQMIAQLGASQRDQAEAKARHGAVIARLEEDHGKATKEFKEAQTALIEGISVWATAHRDRLTNGGRTKTVQLPTGEISWKFGTSSVTHRPLTQDDVVAKILARKDAVYAEAQQYKRERRHEAYEKAMAEFRMLGLFLRTKITLDKEAMHANRPLAEKIEGVSFTKPGETFAVEPLASQIGEVM